MSTKSTKTDSSMILKMVVGKDKNGKDIIKGERFSKVKVTSTDEDIFEVGSALAALSSSALVSIVREDQNSIAQV